MHRVGPKPYPPYREESFFINHSFINTATKIIGSMAQMYPRNHFINRSLYRDQGADL